MLMFDVIKFCINDVRREGANPKICNFAVKTLQVWRFFTSHITCTTWPCRAWACTCLLSTFHSYSLSLFRIFFSLGDPADIPCHAWVYALSSRRLVTPILFHSDVHTLPRYKSHSVVLALQDLDQIDEDLKDGQVQKLLSQQASQIFL